MTAPMRCPLCGTAGSACGPHLPVTPIDLPTQPTKEPGMAELFEYETVVNGITTTLRLTEKDAKRRGITAKKVAAGEPPVERVDPPVQPADDEPLIDPAAPPVVEPVVTPVTEPAEAPVEAPADAPRGRRRG